jgi:DNA mismatch repair protein MutS
MQLPERLAHARNLNVAVRETDDSVVFLHRLEAGGTDRSYGVHVAELAGLPGSVVARATEVLGKLEGEHRVVPGPPVTQDEGQLALFGDTGRRRGKAAAPPPAPARDRVRTELDRLDLDAMTPLEALNRLAALKRLAGEP